MCWSFRILVSTEVIAREQKCVGGGGNNFAGNCTEAGARLISTIQLQYRLSTLVGLVL